MSDFDDLYEVIIVDLKAQVYKADREYFDSRKDALDFVERYNNNPRKDILVAKTVAKYVGRVT